MSKSTFSATIRSFYFGLYKLKFIIGARLAPRRAIASGAALFNTPVRPSPTKLDVPPGMPVPLLREVPLESGAVTLYEWGNPAVQPTILLLHGWNGWALQFAGFVAPLLAGGFAVVALDQRGHGRSAGGYASLPGFIEAAQELQQRLPRLSAVVGHSLGAAAAACSLSDSRSTALKLVLIAPPNNPRVFLEQFAATLGIPIRLVDAMQQRIEQRFRRTFSEISLDHVAPGILARTLVIHDPADNVVPFEHGDSYGRLVKNARLVALGGCGHFKILRSPDAIRLAVEFVAAA